MEHRSNETTPLEVIRVQKSSDWSDSGCLSLNSCTLYMFMYNVHAQCSCSCTVQKNTYQFICMYICVFKGLRIFFKMPQIKGFDVEAQKNIDSVVAPRHKVTIQYTERQSLQSSFLTRVLFSDFYHGGASAQTLAREEGQEYFIFVQTEF